MFYEIANLAGKFLTTSTPTTGAFFANEAIRRLLPISLDGTLTKDFEDADARAIFTGTADLSSQAAPWRISENWDAQKLSYYNEVSDLLRDDLFQTDQASEDSNRSGALFDILKGGVAGTVNGIIGARSEEDADITLLDGQQVNLSDPISAISNSFIERFTSSDRLVGEWAQKLYIQNFGGDVVHDYATRSGSLRLGNDEIWGGVGLGLEDGMVQNSWGARNVVVQQVYDQLINEIGASVGVRNYQIGIDHSETLRSSAVDIGTKRVNLSTLAKIEDRDWGQRVKVKNMEVMVRHDMDNYLGMDTDGESATEVHVEYKGLYIAADTDLIEKTAAVAVGLDGNKVAIIRNLEKQSGYVNVLMNGGWQWIGSFDVPDSDSARQWARLGFGKLNQFYGRFGAGFENNGMPMASVDLQTRNLGLSTEYKKAGNRQVYTYTINIGNTTYSWESEVLPENLALPKLFSTSDVPVV